MPWPRQKRRPDSSNPLVAGWYSWFLSDIRPLSEFVQRWPKRLQRLSWEVGPVRAIALLVAGRRHRVIAVIRRDRGWRSLVLLSALLPSPRKLVVLHFIDNPLRRSGARGVLDCAWPPVERWALRRTMLRAHVLSRWEAEHYSQAYGIEQSRFQFVPFAWRHPERGTPADFTRAATRSGVLSAGRVACDWPTLFAAAQGQQWPLTVVCPTGDRPAVDALNHDGRATVLTDLPQEEVQELLARSAVSVIATREGGISHGHVRLCVAVDAGTPIVASSTRSLEGYVEDGRTAVLTPPGDPVALRAAVNRLLDDPAARDELARAAWERAEGWTWKDYLAGLSALLRGEAQAPGPQAAASSASDASSGSGASWSPSDPGASSRREITLDTPSAPIDTPYR